VVARTADAIRRSLRPREDCARLGDEFLIYAPDCSKRRGRGNRRGNPSPFGKSGDAACRRGVHVSIGIAAHEGGGADYARIHREADTALHQARAEGRNRIVVYDATTAPPLHSDHPPQVLV
jgi:diguanylate cyclase (GGDEF)-like protein